MNTPTTLAAYATALALVLGASVGIGSAVGPVGGAGSEQAGGDGSHDGQGGSHDAGHGDAAAAAPVADGLSVTSGGHTLLVDAAPRTAGVAAPLAFRVLGPDGEAVTAYETEHERELHLVVVRRDATGYQHLHPERTADGTWRTPLLLPTGGTWKVFADLVPAGAQDGLVLATDLTVPGDLQTAAAVPGEQRSATVDGYTVMVQGDLVAGATRDLVFRVSRDGRPVTDLQPHLGARGHLVALREGDLAYLHVHPQPQRDPAEVAFAAGVPAAGDHRLFFEFRHGGQVRTAPLALRAEPDVDSRGTSRTDTHGDTHSETDSQTESHSQHEEEDAR